MTHPRPPSDLDRAERKAFRDLVKTLSNKGVNAAERSDQIADYVRLQSRLVALRETEKGAETGQKLAAARAVNTATTEARRLFDAIHRGTDQLADAAPTSEPVSPDEAEEAWRKLYWKQPGALDHATLKRRYGPPPMRAMVWPSAEIPAELQRLKEANGGRLPLKAWDDIRARYGHLWDVLRPLGVHEAD